MLKIPVEPEEVMQLFLGYQILDGTEPEVAHSDMNSAEVTQRIEKDRNDAILLKVSATPEYFVNGRPLPSFGQQQLANLVREELGR